MHVGKLHFVKFETAKMDSAMNFIKANCLHLSNGRDKHLKDVVRIKATGGGAFKFADIFQVDLLWLSGVQCTAAFQYGRRLLLDRRQCDG